MNCELNIEFVKNERNTKKITKKRQKDNPNTLAQSQIVPFLTLLILLSYTRCVSSSTADVHGYTSRDYYKNLNINGSRFVTKTLALLRDISISTIVVLRHLCIALVATVTANVHTRD